MTPIVFNKKLTQPVHNTLQNLTAGEAALYYYGWPATYRTGKKRGLLVRAGVTHSTDTSSQMVRYETADGGATWSRAVVFSEAGYDIRNYGGGTTSAGLSVIFYGRLSATGWTSIRCMRSTDGATWTHSADLPLYPGVTTAFSPHGRLAELDSGDLLQGFYGSDGTTTYIWTLKSTDGGVTWGSPVLIASGTSLYEPGICALGAGKLIAVVRKDVSTAQKDLLVYNSSDYGATWTAVGTVQYVSFNLPGTSPLIFKKDAGSATVIATNRSAQNNFIEITLPFGSAQNSGLHRYFYEGRAPMSANNIDFGYLVLLPPFNGNEQDLLGVFYDTSTRYDGSKEATDVRVTPLFRRVESILKGPTSIASGTSSVSPSGYITDELTVYNAPTSPTYQAYIRTAGSYAIRLQATYSGSYTSVTFNVQRYNSSGVLAETMYTTGALTGTTFDFTTTQTLAAGESIVLQVVTDAAITVTTHRLTITRQ